MSKPTQLRQAPRRYSQARLNFFRCVEFLAILLGGRILYARLFLGPKRLVLREERLRVDGLDPALDGFTLAQLSDFHAGPFLRSGGLSFVVDTINARQVDACALTGDFVTHDWREGLALTDDLARLESRFGSYAVFGNHDYKGRNESRLAEAYEAVGIRFLRNDSARLECGEAAVTLVGLEDLEEGREVDLERAREGLQAGDVEIVLSHNPLGAPQIAGVGQNGSGAGSACRAILSGHTHGTQIDLPWLRELGPSHPGLRVELGASTLIVSRGLGAVGVPWRHGSPAEVVFVTLERGDAR